MKSLEDMTIGQRVILTVVLVLVILFTLAFVGWISGRWEEDPENYGLAAADEPVVASKYDDEMHAIEQEALDDALRTQLAHLFSVWLRDSVGQPERAMRGSAAARKAYIEVRKEFDKRAAERQKLRELSPSR
jgi:hypothetical protein